MKKKGTSSRSGTLADVLMTQLTVELPHRGITVEYSRERIVVLDKERQLDGLVANEILNFIEQAKVELHDHFLNNIAATRVRRG